MDHDDLPSTGRAAELDCIAKVGVSALFER